MIQGSQRMSAEQIKVRLRTQAGKEFNPASLDEDVRELYKTNQFSNIQTLSEPDGVGTIKVYLLIRDLPNLVQKVTFQGAKHLKPDELQSLTGVRPGTPLNPNLNRVGCQKILAKYEEMGRPTASCELIKGDAVTDSEVVYQITEGPKIKARDIQFSDFRDENQPSEEREPVQRTAPNPQEEEQSPARIAQIIVTGNKRISSESILAHVPLFPGQILTYPDLQRAENALAELGLFVVDPATGVRPTVTVLDSSTAYKDILITVKEKRSLGKTR
jgi:outer membrane protein assembly factor BamA